MATRKKGDLIFIASIWSDGTPVGEGVQARQTEPAIYVRQLRVESWGPKQATFTGVADGEFIRERGYTDSFPHATTREGLAPIIAQQETRLRQRWAGAARCTRAWLAEYEHRAKPEIVASARARLVLEEAGPQSILVEEHAVLVAQLHARMEEERQAEASQQEVRRGARG